MTVIGNNSAANRAGNASRMANMSLQTAMERLSTGKRINSAKDDAAGLAIASRMTAQIRGMNQAVRNANDGISLAQTAEGALGEVTSMLQRMKELATQSANGTLGVSERAALQTETKQLVSQINDIAKSTNFNGVNLFDGSTGSIKLQTGVTAGDSLNVKLATLDTAKLGTGNEAGVAGTGAFEGTAANLGTNQSLRAGDLIINGVSVPASGVLADAASSNYKAASAISKAAAINSVSDQTGVKAVVGETVMSGSAMTAAATAGTVTINGVATASITTTTDAAESRRNVMQAINAISGQTGVVATDSASNNNGLTLTAADGRNIEVSFGGTLTAAASGLKAGAQSGAINLVSTSGDPIELSSAANGNIGRAGLQEGSYAPGAASVSTNVRAPVTGAQTGLAAGQLVINGVSIRASSASDDTVSSTGATSSSKAASAVAIAAAINASSAETGVTAIANAVKLQGTATVTTAGAGTVNINGVAINSTVTATDTAETTRAKALAAINAVSGQTGVVATDEGRGGLTLTAIDGRNVSVFAADADNAGRLGLGTVVVAASGAAYAMGVDAAAASTAYGSVTLQSNKAINVGAGVDGSGAASTFSTLGFEENSYGSDTGGLALDEVNLSSQEGAETALAAIDKALEQIASSRGDLGAVQNRLQVTVNTLTSTSTNLTDARSRIEDTDYSTETAQLAKAQILTQASTAMLAQANQSQQGVLKLLG